MLSEAPAVPGRALPHQISTPASDPDAHPLHASEQSDPRRRDGAARASSIRAEDGELVSRAVPRFCPRSPRHAGVETHPKAKHELFETTIEIITGICETVGEARADLGGTLASSREQMRFGLAPICVGSHPYSSWHDREGQPRRPLPRPRARDAVDAERLLIFGVPTSTSASRSAEKSIAIAPNSAYVTYLPHLLALSASSRTGIHATRFRVVSHESVRSAAYHGLPYRIADWGEFRRSWRPWSPRGRSSRSREVSWDIRPHPDFGTVELRMCDGIPTFARVAAVATLAQVSSRHSTRASTQARRLLLHREWVVRQEQVTTTRHRIEAELIVNDHRGAAPACEQVHELLVRATRQLPELGCAAELEDVTTILERAQLSAPATHPRRRGQAHRCRARIDRGARDRHTRSDGVIAPAIAALDTFLDAHFEELVAVPPAGSRPARAQPRGVRDRPRSLRSALKSPACTLVLPSGTGLVCGSSERATSAHLRYHADLDHALDNGAETYGTIDRGRKEESRTHARPRRARRQSCSAPVSRSHASLHSTRCSHPVRLLFQPAEEAVPRGALDVIEAGVSTVWTRSSVCTAIPSSTPARSVCASADHFGCGPHRGSTSTARSPRRWPRADRRSRSRSRVGSRPSFRASSAPASPSSTCSLIRSTPVRRPT